MPSQQEQQRQQATCKIISGVACIGLGFLTLAAHGKHGIEENTDVTTHVVPPFLVAGIILAAEGARQLRGANHGQCPSVDNAQVYLENNCPNRITNHCNVTSISAGILLLLSGVSMIRYSNNNLIQEMGSITASIGIYATVKGFRRCSGEYIRARDVRGDAAQGGTGQVAEGVALT